MRSGVTLAWLACTACGRIGFTDHVDATLAADDTLGDATTCSVVEIAVGERHACAIRNDGVVLCTGDNNEGQLGLGTTSGVVTTPTPASMFAGAASIRLGRDFTCTRDTSGGVACVGNNDNRQLDGVSSPGRLLSSVTVAVPAARELTLGNTFACAISGTDGYCWGDDDEGQGGTSGSSDFHAPMLLPGLVTTNPRSISAGTDHVCAVIFGGQVVCWGDGRNFRLGYAPGQSCTMASAGNIACQTTPVDAMVGLTVTGVVAGHAHSCAWVAGGSALCWGANDNGQAARPASIEEPEGMVANLTNVTAMIAGRNHTCALEGSGDVSCWGANTALQLGSAIASVPSPVRVPLPAPAVSIAGHAMASFTCARLDDGRAFCWGANVFGQLGRGTSGTSELPGVFPACL